MAQPFGSVVMSMYTDQEVPGLILGSPVEIFSSRELFHSV